VSESVGTIREDKKMERPGRDKREREKDKTCDQIPKQKRIPDDDEMGNCGRNSFEKK